MRLMSFAATVPQMKDRSKTVTRRMGWVHLEVGDLVLACEKTRGIAKEDRHELGVIEITKIHRQPLSWNNNGEPQPELTRVASARHVEESVIASELRAEGFGHFATWGEFVELFCDINSCQPETEISRIEFRHRPELTHCCGAPRAFHLHAVGDVAPACSECGQEVD